MKYFFVLSLLFFSLFVCVSVSFAQTATPPPSTFTPIRTGTPYVPPTSTPMPPIPDDFGDCDPELMGGDPLNYDPYFYARCIHCFTLQELYEFGCYDFWGPARSLQWKYSDITGYIYPDPDVVVQGVFSYTLSVSDNDLPGTLVISYWDGAPVSGADLHVLEIEVSDAYTRSYVSLPYEFMVIDDVRYLSPFTQAIPRNLYFDFNFWGWAGGRCSLPTPTPSVQETLTPPEPRWYLQRLDIDVSSLIYDGSGWDDLERSISISPGWLALVYQTSGAGSCNASLRWSDASDPDLIRYGGSINMSGTHYYCVPAASGGGACAAAASSGLIPSFYEIIDPNPHSAYASSSSSLFVVSRIGYGSSCPAGSQAQGVISYAVRYDTGYPVPTPTLTLTPVPTVQLSGYCSDPVPSDGLPLFVPPTFSPVDLGCYVLIPSLDTLPEWVPWWGLTVCLTGWDVGIVRFFGVDIDIRQLVYFYLFSAFAAYVLDKIYVARGGA